LAVTGCADYYYGKVIDEGESGVPGVTVTVNGQEVETTDEGYFSVRDIDEEGVEIVLKKEGYTEKAAEVVPDPGTLNLGEYELSAENSSVSSSTEENGEDEDF